MPTMPVVSWEMVAKDVKRQASFYGELFGWQFKFDDTGNYANVSTDGLEGTLVLSDPPGSDVYLYVQAPNVQAVVDKAAGAGGKVIHPVTTSPEGITLAFIADAEGTIWGLVQEMPASS